MDWGHYERSDSGVEIPQSNDHWDEELARA
jgi:hypothetical protein